MIRAGLLPCSPLPQVEVQIVTQPSNADKCMEKGALHRIAGTETAAAAAAAAAGGLSGTSSARADSGPQLHPGDMVRAAVDESSAVLLHPPLPLAGVSIAMERDRASRMAVSSTARSE